MEKDTQSTSVAKFVRVALPFSYVVPNTPVAINYAKEAIYEDVLSAFKYGELGSIFRVLDMPDNSEEEVPEFIMEYLKMEEDEEDSEEDSDPDDNPEND